jgi:hypothetical protein
VDAASAERAASSAFSGWIDRDGSLASPRGAASDPLCAGPIDVALGAALSGAEAGAAAAGLADAGLPLAPRLAPVAASPRPLETGPLDGAPLGLPSPE